MAITKKRHRILYNMLFFFLLVGVAPLLITSYKIIFDTSEIMSKNLWDAQNRDVKQISTFLKKAMQDIEKEIKIIAESQGISSFDIPTRHQYLRFHQKHNTWIRHIYIRSAKISPRKIEDSNYKPSPEFLKNFYDPTVFNKVLAGQEYHLGPYISPDRTDLYGVEIIPIESSEGMLEGALYCETDLNFLIDFIKENIVEFRKKAFVIDKDRRIIIHPDLDYYGKSVTTLGIDPGTFSMFVASTFEFGKDGKEKFSGSYISIPEKTWWVVMYESTKDAMWVISGMKWNVIKIGMVTAVFAIILAAVFAGTLSKPIQQLTDAALKIGEGQFGQKINIKSKNELGQLASTFNFMSEKLEEYTAELEKYAREMQELFFSSIQSLSAAIDEKDPYTRGHSDRVTKYSVSIAREMNLSPEKIEEIKIAALLHDIGKIGINDNVLGKPGKLNNDEIALIKQHPVFGANIMSPIKQLKTVIPGMLEHHEKYDGTGYPKGLSGKEISLMGRIIAVADTFDAMTTERPYQKAMSSDFVVDKIIGWKNERFDPEVVDAFVRAFNKEIHLLFKQDQMKLTESGHAKK